MTKNQQYLNYVRHIASLFSGDQQPEDAELVLDNAFSELRGHELEVCQDRDGSAQLEVLLHHSHVSHLTALVEPLLQSANIATWFELMSNVFASHVIDAVFNQLQHCMTDYHVTDADYQSGLNLVRQIVTCMTDAEHRTVLAEHWRQLLTSKYGSYTLRHTYALVHTLLKHATKKGNRKAQTALTNQLSALLTALTWSTDSKYLIDMCHHEATAHVIELVLEIAAESGAEIQRENHVTESSYLWLVDTLLSSETSSDEEHVTEILKRMKHAVWSHVMIALIKHVTALKSNQKWNWSVLYQKYFRTRLVALCAHPVANFVVQSLIATSSTEPHWRMLFTEMEPQFSELLDGRLGVVLNLLNSSVTHVNAQTELIKAVVRVLSSLVTNDLTAKNGKEPDSNALVQETRKQIASLLLHLKNTPRHQYKKQSRDNGAGDSAAKNSFGQYSGIGCQLLSALFQLQHEVNQFVLKSFAQLGKDEHVKMCKDHQASHVIEHFLTSRHVPLNLKQNFIESLKGSFAELAQDKYGSHCVDKCYQNSELSKKEMITKELLKHERELNASFYGKHVLKNCRAEQYKKKRDVWRSKEQQNEKTRERFADILAAPTEDEHVEEKKESHVTESAALNTESRGTKRKRKESVTGVKEESVTGVKEESAEDDIDRVFKKIKPNPRDDDEREEVTLTPVIQQSVSDARLDNIVAALKKTKSKKK